MNVWNGIDAYPDDPPAAVATIGNYDGLHLGHQEILRRVISRAAPRGMASLLVSFTPHPARVLAPDRRPRLLQSRRQRMECLQQTGLSDLLLIAFDEDLAALGGEEFFEQVLDHRIRLAELLVGDNFRFGRDREGNIGLLRRIGARRGFEVDVVPPVQIDGTTVSSSAIRAAIADGEVERARAMLGRPYSLIGEVVTGDGRGHSLQRPTANLEIENEIVPKRGVYITETLGLASRFPSVTNVGIRPTVGGQQLTVETHLLDADENLYGERLEVLFLARLRDEMRFENVSDLADQMARDCAAAESYFLHQGLGR